MSDRIVAILLLVLVLAFGIQALSYVPESYTDVLGARAFPLTVALFMLPLTIVLIFSKGTPRVWPSRRAWKSVIIALVSLIIYGLIINLVGFLIATAAIFIVYGSLYKARLWKTVVAGLLSSLALYALFVWALDMYLPVGRLFEELF
ncbi:MAG: tripartite tricarboxylate transporter TctB family protein [Desulfuromonadales bacterium]